MEPVERALHNTAQNTLDISSSIMYHKEDKYSLEVHVLLLKSPFCRQ